MGLPTYEAKDFGLAKTKYKKFPYDKSVIVTGNEVNEYFKVMLCAMGQVMLDLAEKTVHVGHGMLRMPEGKMSSRAGKIERDESGKIISVESKVVGGEAILEKLQDMVFEKLKTRELSDKENKNIAEKVAVGSFRYSVLKQSIGSDIVYDFEKSISFEGDSGPYLQYSRTRAVSVLEKAKKEKIKASFKKAPEEISQFEKKMAYFPEIVEKAGKNLEPHFLVLYLTELAGEFNSYYAQNRIVDKADEFSPYKIALAQSFAQIMENGMWMLGIETLNKM
jgi:arginyl-tRNA synthetase